jgi:hypothetical protein
MDVSEGAARPQREEPRDDDPFAGLVLDEDFVRGASAYEAPARTRAAIARFP